MKEGAYSLKIPERLMEIAEARAKERYIDRSTALKQLIYQGAEDYVLELIREGKLSASRGAELLNKSIYEIYRVAKEKNVEIGSTPEQYEKGKKTAERIL